MDSCFDSYLELCRPFAFPAPWNCCEADKHSLLGPTDPAAALASLMERHSEQSLVRSGIVKKDADGRLALHPMLAAPDVAFVVLIDTTTGRVRNLMTEAGCVLGDKAPIFEVLGDKHTFDALDMDEQAVFLTDTINDTILLRSFGLAAAPIAGLNRLNQQGINLLCQYYGVTQRLSERQHEEQFESQSQQDDHGLESAPDPNDPLYRSGLRRATPNVGSAGMPGMPPYILPSSGYVGKDEPPIRLTLVRWRLCLMSKTDPVSMQAAVDELKVMARYRHLDIGELSQWTPSERDFEAIRFALSRGESVWIKDALLDGIYSGVGKLDHLKTKPAMVTPPTDLAGAVEHLHETMLVTTDEKSRQRRKEALHNYHRVVARQVTGPMLRQAEAAVDPLDRALQLQFVQLNALFLEKAPTVREQMLQGLSPQREESLKGTDKSVSELLAISGQMVSLAKEMTKWKPRPTSMPSRTPTTKLNLSRRFADSDLVSQN